MLKNEDTFIHLQFSSSAFDFFFFSVRCKKPSKVPFQIYLPTLVCDKLYQQKAACIQWKWWSYCSVLGQEISTHACVFASCFTHVVAARKSNKLITSALNLKSNYHKHWSATSLKPHVRYHIGPSCAIKTAAVEFWTRCGVEIVKWGAKTPFICPNGCYMIWIPQIH